MAVKLSDVERKALEQFVANERKDPEGAWNAFHPHDTHSIRLAGMRLSPDA